jgi:hypothetical protein
MYSSNPEGAKCGEPDSQNVHMFIHYSLKWLIGIISPKENEKKDDKKDEEKKKEEKFWEFD